MSSNERDNAITNQGLPEVVSVSLYVYTGFFEFIREFLENFEIFAVMMIHISPTFYNAKTMRKK
jgi:hypothetical protein